MKLKICSVFFGLAYLFCASFVDAQSENPENKVPAPKAFYEYISPRNTRDFMIALKDAGKRGFRFDKMTTVPVSEPDADKKKKKEMVLAGIVKYDGANRYDYNFFFAEAEENPDATLNNLSKGGWYFRDVLSVMTGTEEVRLPVEDGFANRAKKLPALGNLYLLERLEGQQTPHVYKLFKAAVGTGRAPTVKLQAMLEQALTEGYVPVATYFTVNLKNLFSIDSASAILVEKRDGAKKYEYKFVRGNQSDGLWKDIDEFAKQGFRIGLMNYTTAMLYRESESAAPVSYTHLHSSDKDFQAALAATLGKNPTFHSTISYGDGLWMNLHKNVLIFETGATAAAEYKFANLLPIIPKQYRKNAEEFAKTLEKPEIIFQKALGEGFAPRDLYYSDAEGLIIVFSREKK
jgi:hypothetical protein